MREQRQIRGLNGKVVDLDVPRSHEPRRTAPASLDDEVTKAFNPERESWNGWGGGAYACIRAARPPEQSLDSR